MERIIIKIQSVSLDKESDEYSVYYDRGYKVIPKKENYTEAAKYLSNIMDIFKQAASFES